MFWPSFLPGAAVASGQAPYQPTTESLRTNFSAFRTGMLYNTN
jgi:hypothetical protein